MEEVVRNVATIHGRRRQWSVETLWSDDSENDEFGPTPARWPRHIDDIIWSSSDDNAGDMVYGSSDEDGHPDPDWSSDEDLDDIIVDDQPLGAEELIHHIDPWIPVPQYSAIDDMDFTDNQIQDLMGHIGIEKPLDLSVRRIVRPPTPWAEPDLYPDPYSYSPESPSPSPTGLIELGEYPSRYLCELPLSAGHRFEVLSNYNFDFFVLNKIN